MFLVEAFRKSKITLRVFADFVACSDSYNGWGFAVFTSWDYEKQKGFAQWTQRQKSSQNASNKTIYYYSKSCRDVQKHGMLNLQP